MNPTMAKEEARAFKTPKASKAPKGSESFATYDLSPPTKTRKGCKMLDFDQSMKKIQREMKQIWREGDDDTKKIVLFLISRGFRSNVGQGERKRDIEKLLNRENGARKRMLTVLNSNGDVDVASERVNHYAVTCMAIFRYFEQDGAVRFTKNASVNYYLREQRHNSCFLQAACVAMSYVLQAWGKSIPPPDGSKLIRHNFTDDQLIEYVDVDEGGDCIWVYKLLDRQFFECHGGTYPLWILPASGIEEVDVRELIVKRLEEGPGLVSKFEIPVQFEVDFKRNPKRCVGYARFTVYGEKAEWIELEKASDQDSRNVEVEMKGKWRDACNSVHPLVNVESLDDLTLGTAPTSSVSEIGDTSRVLEGGIDSNEEEEFESADYPLDESLNSFQIKEGDGVYHAMVLLGSRKVDGETFWLIQNSYSSKGMRLLEMSSDYLASSNAEIVFLTRGSRRLRKETASKVTCCSSPVAESGLPGRDDRGHWNVSLLDYQVKEIAREGFHGNNKA